MDLVAGFWGYVTLGVSAIFTQELAALVGGFAAEQGHLELPLVFMTVGGAVFAESVGLYYLGRWRSAWVRLRLRKAPPVARKLLSSMRYSPWRSTILSRFAFGARIPLPLACGAARVPPWIYLTGSAVAAAVWAGIFVAIGWVFGEGAVLVVGEVRKYEWVVGLVLVIAGALAIRWLKKREAAAPGNQPS